VGHCGRGDLQVTDPAARRTSESRQRTTQLTEDASGSGVEDEWIELVLGPDSSMRLR